MSLQFGYPVFLGSILGISKSPEAKPSPTDIVLETWQNFDLCAPIARFFTNRFGLSGSGLAGLSWFRHAIQAMVSIRER